MSQYFTVNVTSRRLKILIFEFIYNSMETFSNSLCKRKEIRPQCGKIFTDYITTRTFLYVSELKKKLPLYFTTILLYTYEVTLHCYA